MVSLSSRDLGSSSRKVNNTNGFQRKLVGIQVGFDREIGILYFLKFQESPSEIPNTKYLKTIDITNLFIYILMELPEIL